MTSAQPWCRGRAGLRCGEEFGRRGYVVDVAHTGGDFGEMQGEVDRRGDGETRAAQVDKQKQREFFRFPCIYGKVNRKTSTAINDTNATRIMGPSSTPKP